MARITISGKGRAVKKLARIMETAGHSLVDADTPSSEQTDLIILEGKSPEEITRLVQKFRSDAAGYIPALLAANGEKQVPGHLDDVIDDVVTEDAEPDLVRVKIAGILRMKSMMDQLSEENRQIVQKLSDLEDGDRSMTHELRLASRLQTSLLPPPQFTLPGARFTTKLLSASSVSGDFFDIFRLDESHIGFYVADARGHGVPAALLTVYVKKALWTKDIKGKSYRIVGPAEALAKLNGDLIADHLSDAHFITMCYAIFNTRTSELVWCNGGHPPIILLDESGDMTLLTEGGPLLGVFEDEYGEGRTTLAPGQKILMYSDGVEYARGRYPSAPRIENFYDIVRPLAAQPAGEMIQNVLQNGFAHVIEGGAMDDITILAMERDAPPAR